MFLEKARPCNASVFAVLLSPIVPIWPVLNLRSLPCPCLLNFVGWPALKSGAIWFYQVYWGGVGITIYGFGTVLCK